MDDRFFQKIENRGITITLVNSILINKSINLQLFTLILYIVEVRCDHRRFSVHSPFIEKSMFCLIIIMMHFTKSTEEY